MSLLRTIHEVSTDRFSYRNKMFTTEASLLRDLNCFGQIYDDAADVGFALRNPKTGESAVFAFEKDNIDRDGDVISWVFRPVSEYVRRNAALRNVSVVVFND